MPFSIWFVPSFVFIVLLLTLIVFLVLDGGGDPS